MAAEHFYVIGKEAGRSGNICIPGGRWLFNLILKESDYGKLG